jgi:hypothetical protein
VYGRLTIIDGDPDRADLLPEPQETTMLSTASSTQNRLRRVTVDLG